MKRLWSALSLAAAYLAVWPALGSAQLPPSKPAPQAPAGQPPAAASKPADAREAAKALARRIDETINARLAEAQIKPAPKASYGQLGRRLHLDLAGKIPNLLEIRDFVDPTNDNPNKFEERVEKLLAAEEYARHFSHIWRAILLQGTNNSQFQGLEPQLEQWLKARLQSNTTYDKLVQEILTLGQGGVPVGPGGGSPQAFWLANENKPENLAGATSRIFLGVKLECAQCHPHPFAKWTRNQFWEYAAFFSGAQQFGRRPGGPVPGGQGREIRIPNTDKVVKAKFLDGTDPQWKDGISSTRTLADWMTSADNPYFARAAVDHLWTYFFGVSLVEPIMEPNDDNPATHPELLNLLAKEFIASGYDLKFLIRAIVFTEAYQRVSGSAQNHRDEIYLFARMPVRGVTAEQLFDSLCEATDYTDPYANQPQFRQVQFQGGPVPPRVAYLNKFASQERRTESQTSILQALFMMNGKFLAERTKLENNNSLRTIATAPTSEAYQTQARALTLHALASRPVGASFAVQSLNLALHRVATARLTTMRRVDTLYMLVLSRSPRAEELERMVSYIERGGATGDPQQAVADVYWVLLNSGEFMLNH